MNNIMNEVKDFFLTKLNEEFARRVRKNASYSLRAYARFLDINPATLSAILKRKRPLPAKYVFSIMDKLELTDNERNLFQESVKCSRSSYKKNLNNEILTYSKVLEDGRYFKIIAEWEYYGILSLLQTDQQFKTPKEIAVRIGIEESRAQAIMDELLDLNFIKINEFGAYERHIVRLKTSEDILSKALQASHIEALDLAKDKLESIDVMLRDFSSITMAIDPEKIDDAKKLIRTFRKQMNNLFESGEKREVYQCNIQLFPLSKTEGVIQ